MGICGMAGKCAANTSPGSDRRLEDVNYTGGVAFWSTRRISLLSVCNCINVFSVRTFRIIVRCKTLRVISPGYTVRVFAFVPFLIPSAGIMSGTVVILLVF